MTTETTKKYTPGPWHVYKSSIISDTNYKRLAGGDWKVQALAYTVGNDDATFENGEVYANARLIAAAPELLEALEAMERAHGHWGGSVQVQGEANTRARAAIAKATGVSQ